jgi:transcription initiation factor TFIID TATA-box-binding protein
LTVEKTEVKKLTHIKVPAIKVQNRVVSGDLHATIDLYALSKDIRAVDYEPEQFPGAIYRIVEPKAVIILFKNGKLICTGTKSEANVKRVLAYASKVVSKYVISVNPPQTRAQIRAENAARIAKRKANA